MRNLIFIFTLVIAQTSLAEGGAGFDFDKTKNGEIQRLKKRKMSFDEYLKEQQRLEDKRMEKADQMKGVRKVYAERLEKARKSFHRNNTTFPVGAWRNFIKERDQKEIAFEKARRNYGQMQKELRRIYDNREYKIDGNKEFKL